MYRRRTGSRYYVTSDAIMNLVPYKRMEVRHANEVEILKQDGTIVHYQKNQKLYKLYY